MNAMAESCWGRGEARPAVPMTLTEALKSHTPSSSLPQDHSRACQGQLWQPLWRPLWRRNARPWWQAKVQPKVRFYEVKVGLYEVEVAWFPQLLPSGKQGK